MRATTRSRGWSDLIFDLDGTLIDSAPNILAGFETVLREAGIAPAVPISASLIGPPLLQTLALLTNSKEESLLSSLAESFKAYYDQTGVFLTRAFSDVPQMLHNLSEAGFGLHIATNKRRIPTQAILQTLGWKDLFNSVYTQDKAPGHSSKSAMLSNLLTAEDINPENTIYIGDTPEDSSAASANGLSFIAVDWGYGNFYNRPKDAAPLIRVGSCAELLKALMPETSTVASRL